MYLGLPKLPLTHENICLAHNTAEIPRLDQAETMQSSYNKTQLIQVDLQPNQNLPLSLVDTVKL